MLIRRVAAAAFVLVVLAVDPLAARATPIAVAAPSPAVAVEPAIRLVAQDPGVAAGGTFNVFLDVEHAPAGSDLAVDVYDRIEDDEGLAAVDAGEPEDIAATFAVLPLADAELDTQRTGFSISVAGPAGPWSYPLREPGAYPVRIRLRGPAGEGTLASIVTYLIRTPADPSAASARVALVAEIHQPPGEATAPDPVGTTTSSTTVADDPDADDTATDGSTMALDRAWLDQVDAVLDQLTAHPDVPVSFAVTPDTAAALEADGEAEATLDALRAELVAPGRELLSGTYVDLDVAALVDADLGDEVLRQTDLGRRTLSRVLGEEGTDTWLEHDPIDRPSAELLQAVGVAHLLLPAGAFGADPPSTPVPLGEGLDLTAMAALDPGLAVRPDDPVLAGHQLLGRLTAAAAIDPDGAGRVVWIDPTTVDPDELAVVLAGLDPGGAVRATTADGLFAAFAPDAAPVELPDRPAIDLGLYPDRTRRTHDLLGSYTSMLADPRPVNAAYEVLLARAASRDLPVAARLDRLGVIESDLEDRLAGIDLPARDRVTLGASDAEFPLRLTSRLDQPVKVVVTLEASDRLELPEEPIVREVAPGSTLLEIPVHTRAPGDTPLRIKVSTPDGKVVLAETSYTIRSTAVSGVGLILTVGAAGFLALWWGRHLFRSRRSRRARHARGGHHDHLTAPTAPTGDAATADATDDVFVADV